MNKKIFISITLFILLLLSSFFSYKVFSKYVFDYSFTSAQIHINKKPEIELISISNDNNGYETYANNTHNIIARVKIIEKNIAINNFNSDNINILIDNEKLSIPFSIKLISQSESELIYDIYLNNLNGNGNLYIEIPFGVIQDSYGQKNDYTKFNTNILIDNVAPIATYEELSIEDDKSNYIINSNEFIRPIDNWNITNNNYSISKIFSSPIYYLLPITDYAGNISEIPVDINNAKNIMLYYATYNKYRISKFDSNGEIAGKQALTNSTYYNCELILAYLDGNIDNNILQARAFDYTYWGENTTARCHLSEISYKYGYNPDPSGWYDINTKNAVPFLGKLCLQLGGQGQNSTNNSCKELSNPIPENIANQNLYGLSGIAFKLNNSSDYSIVYQIYVKDIGWLKAASDGEESTYSHDKPFSAIRINLVSKSDKKYLLNYWNSFIGTHTID